MTDKKYSIIWKHFTKESPIGLKLNVNDKFSLPYFIDGIDKEKFESKESLDLGALHLIKGILVAYNDDPPDTDTSIFKSKAKQILNEHLPIIKEESLETLIINFSAYLREKNGQEASLSALLTGTKLVPDSHLVKFDCCLDLYNSLIDNILKERQAAIRQLALLLNDLDVSMFREELSDPLLKMKTWLNSELKSKK
jgi:hypothetical protein